MPTKPKLKLIRGTKDEGIQIGAVHLTPASRTHPPFPVSIQVHAEDTWRVLSADIRLKESSEHPVRVSTALIEDQPTTPGSILTQGNRWLAIIYDLEQQPICREEWITQAMERLLNLAADKGIDALRLPLLGTEHGDLPWQRSLALICQALQDVDKGPKRIWLIMNRVQINECWEQLQRFSTNTANT